MNIIQYDVIKIGHVIDIFNSYIIFYLMYY